MSQPLPDLDAINPRIVLKATLSPSTLSISQASPNSSRIILHLRVRLADSPIPITIQLPGSALSPASQGYSSSYYHLTSIKTGQHPRQIKTHGLRGPSTNISHPDQDLLVLYPDDEAEINIPIGIQICSEYRLKRKEPDKKIDSRWGLAIAATPLIGLEVEEQYAVELKDIMGEFPGYVWWWDFGDKADVVKKRAVPGKEGSGFDVPVVDCCGKSRQIWMEMVDPPVLTVKE